MSFKKLEPAYKAKAEEQTESAEYALLCTAGNCGMRWSVNMGRPLCSYHAWGAPYTYPAADTSPVAADDGRGWARKILRRQAAGTPVSIAAVKMAEQALKGWA